MASAAGGLTRRRGGGRGAEENNDSSRVSSPIPNRNGSPYDNTPETSFTGGENGHKIAFDPRDMSENEERSKQPKLTLMEEVLLLGLKDKQVWLLRRRFRLLYCCILCACCSRGRDYNLKSACKADSFSRCRSGASCYDLLRAIYLSGTRVFLTPYEDVS